MLSVIICSRSPELFKEISDNISRTIGINYEIIRINNGSNSYSICSAYNEGARQAKFKYLCLVHEDVFFRTGDWGTKLLAHFASDEKIGLIGIAGAVYKSKMSSAWWHTETGWHENRRMNIVQHHKNANKPTRHITINPFNEIRSRVVSLDGVFLATKKESWLQHPFDEKLLKGFHGYDLDFALQIGQQEKVVVIYDVLIDHFSGGSYDLLWMTELMKVHKKWKQHLPVSLVNVEPDRKTIYSNGWKRLRKNIAFVIKQKPGFLSLIKSYHFFFTMLDEKPVNIGVPKQYVVELIKASKLYYNSRKSLS